jgi:hypothetical protein
MLVFGIMLSFCGIGVFCWLLFTFAIYALPFFVGLNIALAAFHSGAGVIGAFIVGIFSGAAAMLIGQIVFVTVKAPAIRISIALMYAIPAAIAGYSATLGLAQIGIPSTVWREIFAIIGGGFVGCTALARLALENPLASGPGVSVRPAQLPIPAGTRPR